MEIAIDQLPDNPDELKAIILAERAKVAELETSAGEACPDCGGELRL